MLNRQPSPEPTWRAESITPAASYIESKVHMLHPKPKAMPKFGVSFSLSVSGVRGIPSSGRPTASPVSQLWTKYGPGSVRRRS